MISGRLGQYQHMWTTDLQRYALIELDPTRPNFCIVEDVETGGWLTMDDDDDVISAVIKHMRDAGVRVKTRGEAGLK
jgi:hypothetical protein